MTITKLITIICPLLAECALLFCGAFFASTETAFTALSRITVRQMEKNKEKNYKQVSKLRANLDTLISTVLVGTNLVTTLISSIATAYTIAVFNSSYVTYATAIVSMLVIIFSEIIPKNYAVIRPKQVAIKSAIPIQIIQKTFFPIVLFFQQLTKLLNILESHLIKNKRPLVTEEELRTLIDLGKKEGTLEDVETKMLDRLFDFSDVKVHDIMRHRSLVKYVSSTETYENVIKIFETGFSRIPVYEDKENEETIIGVLHYKNVLFANTAITKSKDFVKICMRPVMFVPETFSAIELLQKFKKEKDNFAVVLNEYSGMEGIVTMDDILSEVFGHITDENGDCEIAPEKRITVINSYEFIVPGDMKLDDFNDVLKMNLDSECFETLGGWLLEKFGELPPIGAVYKNDNSIFIVEDQSSRRIQSVRIKMKKSIQ